MRGLYVTTDHLQEGMYRESQWSRNKWRHVTPNVKIVTSKCIYEANISETVRDTGLVSMYYL